MRSRRVFGKWVRAWFAADVGWCQHKLESTLEPAWRRAIEVGYPVALWRAGTVKRNNENADDSPRIAAPAEMRAGVYLPELRRFLPMGPPITNAFVAVLSPERAEVTIVKALRTPGMPSMLSEIEIRAYDALRSTSKRPAMKPDPRFQGPEVIELASNTEGSYFRAIVNRESAAPARASSWHVLAGQAPSNKLSPHLHVMAEGAWLGVSAGFDDFGWQESLPLKFHWNARTERGTWRVEYQLQCTLDSDEARAIQEYKVSLQGAGHSTIVTSGSEPVSARIGFDGKLLLQIGRRLHAIDPANPLPNSTNQLPDGLVLATPVEPKFCYAW
jgi:hypothetical protein